MQINPEIGRNRTPIPSHDLPTGILLQDSYTLATQLALWQETDIWKIAYTWIQVKIDNLDRPDNNRKRALEAIQKRIRFATENKLSKSPASLQADIIEVLIEHLDIQKRPNPSVGDLNDICGEIVEGAVRILQSTEKGEFKDNDGTAMICYCMEKQFEEFRKQFERMSPEWQDETLEYILQTLQEMPPEQRDKILKEIGTERLSQDIVRKALITGALGTAMITVVKVAGFSAYVFAVKMLASIAGLVGLTLPFVAYTALTSLIAFITQPWILIIFFFGGAHWAKRSIRRKIHDKLLPILVSNTLVVAHQNCPRPDPEPLLSELRLRWNISEQIA